MRTKILLVAVVGVALVVSAPAFATTSVRAEQLDLEQVARQLRRGQQLRVEAMPLNESGSMAALRLERFEAFAPGATVVVHGEHGVSSEAAPHNIYFRGAIEGRPGSRVLLTLREAGGIRGVLSDGGRYWMAERLPGGSSSLRVREIDTEAELRAKVHGFQCGTDQLAADPKRLLDEAFTARQSSTAGVPAKSPANYTARVSVETDYEFYQLFGSTSAATEYIGDLIAYASTIYDAEVDTTLVVESVSLWTSSGDPWDQSSTICNLYQFGRYWNHNNTAIDRTIAFMMSGKNNGGGVAWTGVLCTGPFNPSLWGAGPSAYGCSLTPESDNYGGAYGYAGDMDGNFDIDNPGVIWDIVAVSHEIGHMFGSPHTHCYAGIGSNPSPVDQCYSGECGSSGCWCGAQSLPGCSAGGGCGTIMSYCHLLSGGMGNISMTFGLGHPYGVEPDRVPTVMRDEVVSTASSQPSCLQLVIPGGIFSDGFESGGWCSWSSPSCP